MPSYLILKDSYAAIIRPSKNRPEIFGVFLLIEGKESQIPTSLLEWDEAQKLIQSARYSVSYSAPVVNIKQIEA